jgi:predicted transcriptional regulator
MPRNKRYEIKLSDNNYATIPAFARIIYNLKGQELLVYSIIYGFSQCCDQMYTGTVEYLCAWTGTCEKTMITTLKSLCDKGYLVKERISNTENHYRAISPADYQKMLFDKTVNITANGKYDCKNYSRETVKITATQRDINIYNNTPPYPPNQKNKDFQKLWDTYPKCTAKPQTWAVFQTMCDTSDTFAAMLDAIGWQKDSEDWKREHGRYIPLLITWLTNQRWLDKNPIVSTGVQPVDPKPDHCLDCGAPLEKDGTCLECKKTIVADKDGKGWHMEPILEELTDEQKELFKKMGVDPTWEK